MPISILHLEDDTSDATLIRLKLKAAGIDARITRATTRVEFEKALRQCGYEVILADYNLPGYDGLAALRLTQEVCPEIPFIFVSGMMAEETAIEALTQGATDYVFKQNLARLGPAVQRALENAANQRERRRAEEKFSRVFQISPIAMSISTISEGRFIDANAACLKMLGYSRAETIGHTSLELGIWNDSENRKALEARRNEALSFSNSEIILCTKDQRQVLCKATFTNLEIDGEDCVLASLEDVTERRKTEQALKESEEKFRTFADESPNMIFINQRERVVYVNNKCEEMLGYTKEEFYAPEFKFQSITAPEDVERLEGYFRKHLNGKDIPAYEYTAVAKDGRRFNVIITTKLIPYENEKAILGIITDITDRKQAEEALGRQLTHLRALHTINQAIIGSLDLKRNLDLFLQQVIAELHVDAAAVLIFNPHMHILEDGSSAGFQNNSIPQVPERLGEGYTGQVALDRRMVSIKDLPKTGFRFARVSLLTKEGFCDYFGLPLIAKGDLLGVLEIFHRTALATDPEWLDLLEALADQAAIFIDNAQLFNDLQRTNIELEMAYNTTLEGWSAALDLRDKETEGHTQRVTEMTVQLAHSAGLTEEEILHVRRGALLHDIGKMGIPDAILMKAEPLSEAEWVIMRKHPVYAYELLYAIKYLRPAIDIPYCHHEKWDGSGYPRNLKREQIPLAARIFAVVDVWDALTSDRPYRAALPREKALDEIRSGAGRHFDPQVAELFLKYIKEKV